MQLRSKMLALLDCTHIEETFETAGKLLAIISLAAMMRSNVYIVAEKNLHTYARLFKSWDLHVQRVVCSLPKDFDRVDDVEIVAPKDLLTDKMPRKFFFLFTPDFTAGDDKNFWSTQFDDIPAADLPNQIFIVDGNNKLVMNANTNDRFEADRMYYYQSHKAELMNLFDMLADETSKLTLYRYVESYVRNCVYKGEHIPTRWKYFFGGRYEQLYEHLDGECWINCGASLGDTVFQYLSFDFKPKKIYAFEGNNETYNIMVQNLKLLPQDKCALVKPINEFITATTDFEKILAGDKCTLLNADIEGAELPMLRAMKNIIQADRPVMAICVYHLKEDLLTVPQFIQSLCPNYIFYLRKYTSFIGRFKNNGELVFYAVPAERNLLPCIHLHKV